NSILYLDCKNLEYENIKSNKKFDYSIVMVYSGIERVLYETSYNKRVEECKNAGENLIEFSGENLKKDIYLRDVNKEIFLKYKNKLPEDLRRRVEHFYSEMERVEKGIQLWKNGDIEGFGKLIKESGESSIKNYQCGAEELIKIYEILNSIKGIYGARFSGAGFGGWSFGFIKNEENVKREIIETLKAEYLKIYPQYERSFKIVFIEKKLIPSHMY
ncbi:MAG: hypothetical protein NC833_05920, partial [Candidatus Omnitrophica bacterium]|nr:hypothetical protein [Candidatus Omnitrophota bacterium]